MSKETINLKPNFLEHIVKTIKNSKSEIAYVSLMSSGDAFLITPKRTISTIILTVRKPEHKWIRKDSDICEKLDAKRKLKLTRGGLI